MQHEKQQGDEFENDHFVNSFVTTQAADRY